NTSGALELEARVHREPRYEFLEPVLVELRLKNTSSTACIVDANALTGDGVAIIVQKNGSPPQRWTPFSRRCAAPQPKVLEPGEAIYAPVFLSASTSGWLISEPGSYRIYAAQQSGWPGTCSPGRSRTPSLSADRACWPRPTTPCATLSASCPAPGWPCTPGPRWAPRWPPMGRCWS